MAKLIYSTPSTVTASNDDSSSGTKPGGRNSITKRRPDDEDEDETNILDPFIAAILSEAGAETEEADNDSETSVLGFVPIKEPLDLDASEDDASPLEVPIALDSNDSPFIAHRDDEQGPLAEEALIFPEIDGEVFTDGAEEGPIESSFDIGESGEYVSAIHTESDSDESTDDALAFYVDDAELPWAKERWAEYPLGQAFSAARHVALIGSTLCVAGETSMLLDAKRCAGGEVLELGCKSLRILARDSDAKELVVLTTSGKLLAVARRHGSTAVIIPPPSADAMVCSIWQLAPGSPVMLVQTENGQVFELTGTSLTGHQSRFYDGKTRPLAMSELGEPRVSLSRGPIELEVLLEAGDEQHRFCLNAAMKGAVAEGRPLLVGFNDWVLFGVRGSGLWTCRTNEQSFSPVPGCRGLTAATVGRTGGRSTAFIALFSELEDRAEIAILDLATGRACRIAELLINSDYAGTEDDPPELARIESLVWDQTNGKLWVAGGFGLACFCQPGNVTLNR